MIDVSVFKQSNYPVSAIKIKKSISKILAENGIISDSEVSVAIVGEKKMVELAGGAENHPVLSFPSSETKEPFIFPPDGKIHLGEIVLSYKSIVDEANKTGILIDDVAVSLVEHGTLHLVGKHHE